MSETLPVSVILIILAALAGAFVVMAALLTLLFVGAGMAEQMNGGTTRAASDDPHPVDRSTHAPRRAA